MTAWSFQKRFPDAVTLLTAFAIFISGFKSSFAQPSASFSAIPTVGCAPLTVAFSNTSSGANSYYWDFGNGNTSTLANPSTVYLTPGFFTVILIAINTSNGQRDTLTASNYIHTVTPPNADFSALPLAGCAGEAIISFTNSSTGAVTYTWDFGDGGTSTLQNPTHVYATAGNYTIKLIATNGFGCNDIEIKNNYITIHPKPNANFTSPVTSSCDSTDAFAFSNNAPGNILWLWDFGDGATSTLQNPTHVYNAIGSFTVTLIATNNWGCIDTVTISNYINIGNTLVPNFTVNNSTGCGTLNAIFNCSVPNATGWLWNFGDGGTSTLQNPSHLYTNTGNYNVTLTVTTTTGCNGTVTLPNYILIDPLPVANFTVAQVNPCDPYTFQFTNTSTDGITYLWEFGDGTTATSQNPVHVYPEDSTYNVTIHVFSANGCETILTLDSVVNVIDYKPMINGIPRIGCTPLPVNFTTNAYPGAISWLWNFGDGNTSTLQNPSHTYTATGDYAVKLNISTVDGCLDSNKRTNYIKVVDGQISYTPDTFVVCLPFTVPFIDPTEGRNYWHWDFGNGDTSNQQNPTYAYLDTGTYVVTLQTSMAGGCSQFLNPYAIFVVKPFIPEVIHIPFASPCSPYTIQIMDSVPGVTEWLWDFGDGTTDTAMSPTHIYAQPGTYTITVYMIIPDACPTTHSVTVTFGHPNPIQINNTSMCSDDTIHFSIATPLAFTSYNWNFGDGSSISNLQNPDHVYGIAGDYITTLITTDTSGCVDTFYTDTLEIRALTVGFITSDPTTSCDNLLVHFTNTSVNAVSYLWNFGDSTTGTGINPNHNYSNPGSYNVTLTATSGGCVKSLTQPNFVTVYEALANFSFSTSGNCYPVTVNYTDLSVNPVVWFWEFGDGTTDIVQSPTHVFTSQPDSSVRLTIIDNHGCVDVKTKTNITGTPVKAFISDTLGCSPFIVSFSDSTNNATSWLWDFGDGNSSTQQNPVHTYSANGSYIVHVSVMLAGCTTQYTFPIPITVIDPVADFVSPTVAVCAPSLVQFNNLSLNAVSYLWGFGDGTTSNAQNPSHIYNVPGDYTIALTVTDSLGCTGTEIKIDYIHVPGTFAYFNLVSQLNCLNTFVVFQDSSINATGWNWNFGDGYTDTVQNPQHLYQDTGSYIVSLITTDSLGCTSVYTYPDTIFVYPVPNAQGTSATLGGCNPYTASFTNSSTGAVSYVWHFGDGDTSTAVNPVHIYNNAGVFTAQVVAINQFGCTDTFSAATVTVNETPLASFIIDTTTGCSGSAFTITNTSTNLSNPNYYWSAGTLVSAQQTPSFTFVNPGFYSVQLIIVNSNGCSDTTIQTNVIEVYDTMPPPAATMLSVSVLNNTSVEIKWLPCAAFDLEEYRLFRFNSSTNIFDLIYSELHPGNSNPNVTGYYLDNGLNTLQNTYTYKIQTIDRCGYRLVLDSSVAHTTINVTAVAVGQNINVGWTPYGDCPVSGYEINRTEVQSSLSQLLGTIAPNTLTYTDSALNCPFEYSYRITALDLCGNAYTSLSDTAVAVPVSPLVNQAVEVMRSTVVNNKSVLTEWLPPVIARQRVLKYNILRSTDNMNFTLVGSVPAAVLSFTDDLVDVMAQNYFYRVDVINDCNLAGILSNNSSSILLQSDYYNDITWLWWTGYDKWDAGVDYYLIEKLDENGVWKQVKVVAGTTTEAELDE